jgi:phage N-6-adenine-methyltransferase
MKITGPTIARGQSKQDYATPPDFMAAVSRKFGPLTWDLAASKDNTKAPYYYTEADNSLSKNWNDTWGTCWLNPPFSNITPWAKHCSIYGSYGRQILFLVPASVGSNWFRDYVFHSAMIYFLNGRIKFIGCTDHYPKDCMLCHYGVTPGIRIWSWQQ